MEQRSLGTLAEMYRRNAVHHPHELAVKQDRRELTFAELHVRACAIASGLARVGILPGDRVAVLAVNSIEFFELYAAAELSGVVVVPINYRLTEAEIETIVIDAEPKAIVFDALLSARARRSLRVQSIKIRVSIGPSPDAELAFADLAEAGHGDAPVMPRPEDAAHILYTSGTTGASKGCIQTQSSSCFSAAAISSGAQMDCQDRGLLVMPACHAGGKRFQMAMHWRAGAIVILSKFDPEHVLKLISEERVTTLHLAPTMIHMLVESFDAKHHDVSSVHTIIYGAASMPVPLLQRGLATFGPVFLQMWGQSEGDALILSKRYHKTDDDQAIKRLGSIGHPSPGVDVMVADDAGKPVPIGTPGEMLLQTPSVMSGYWRRDAETADVLRDGWLRTGDMVVMDDDGFVYLVDRKKDLIISGGLNISSREVEDVLFAHEAIRDAAVVSLPDDKWGEIVCAVIVLNPGQELRDDDLLTHCRDSLSGFKVPRRIVRMSELPRLASGKVDKKVLRRNVDRPASESDKASD